MIPSTVEQGRRNLAVLERSVLKDNTLLPGERYGGTLHLQPLAAVQGGAKTYSIALLVGNDQQEIDVVQSEQ